MRFALVLLLLGQAAAHAQEPPPAGARQHVTTALAVTGIYWAGAIVVMDRVWYRDQPRASFHFFDDSRSYLQIDKAGHAFGAYLQSYVGYHALREVGLRKREALLYGGAAGLILQTPIEIMDGLHEGWGFSWADMAANAAGSALVVGQELLVGGQVAKYKFSYRESPYAGVANGYLGNSRLERMFEDYNGHTYWLSLPVRTIAPAPAWLNVAVGMSANGMIGEFENIREHEGVSIPRYERVRQFLLAPDIDWPRIRTDSPVLSTILNALTFVKAPLPALEIGSNGALRGYWLYF